MGGITRDRAQILLIGGLLLAVSIIALAVVFNSAVYTSAMSDQVQRDVSEYSVRTIQEDVRNNVRDLIRRAIKIHPHDRKAQIKYVKSRIPDINRNFQQYAVGTERIVNISFNGTFNSSWAKPSPFSGENFGFYLHNDTGPITDDSGNWLGDYSRVRNFELNATIDNRGTFRDFFWINISTTTGGYSVDPFAGNPEYAVKFNYSGLPGDFPEIEVYRDSYERGECQLKERMTSSNDPYAHVDFTNATVNGKYCNAIDFFSHIRTPYDINIDNGSRANGSFRMTTTHLPLNHDWPNSEVERRLYGVLIDLDYYGPRFDYNATLAVAPGEPS